MDDIQDLRMVRYRSGPCLLGAQDLVIGSVT
jgi:hypothetical protein